MTSGTSQIHDDRRLPALTGLRFVAAAAVVVAHATEQGWLTSTRGLTDALDGGRTAVALFFVLSGFVLAYNYPDLAGRTERRAFWAARVARIYPLVLLALVVAGIGTAYAWVHRSEGLLAQWYSLDHSVLALLGAGLLAQLTATVGWFPSGGITSVWNPPAWSISVEVAFYLAFPLMVVLARRLRTSRLVAVCAAVWALQGIWLLLLQTALPEGTRRTLLVHQFPLSHVFEFTVGIAAALLFSRGLAAWAAQGHRRALLVGGSTAVLVVLSVWPPFQPAHYLMDPFFAVLVVGLAAPARGPAVLGSAWLVRLGEASFSLYLLHAPLMVLARAAGFDGGQLATVVLVVAITGVSLVVFRWFETPARRRLRARLAPRSTPTRV